MRLIASKLAILAVLGAICSPVAAQVAQATKQGLTGFLERIGGSTDVKLLDRGKRPLDQPTARFVESVGMIGGRYFRTNRHADSLADVKRAQIVFNEECLAAGGTVEADASPVSRLQQRWASADLPAADRYVVYHGVASVCTRGASPIGGMVALIEDCSAFGKTSSVAPLMSIIAPLPNRTAVYAFAGSSISLQADIDRAARRDAADTARDHGMAESNRRAMEQGRLEEERRTVAWRKTITIGTRTSCGLVIDVRGPLAQVQLPAGTTYNGVREHWVESDQLNDVASRRERRF